MVVKLLETKIISNYSKVVIVPSGLGIQPAEQLRQPQMPVFFEQNLI
jgi:hypothetical protein